METRNAEQIRTEVRERYAGVAKTEKPSAGCGCSSGCGGKSESTLQELGIDIGYSKEELAHVPDGANMGLGCGNPIALATLKPGETVLDLGSGGGFDCFLAARAVGKTGKVIGVDMTPEMVSKLRESARREGFQNVEARLGEIEHLPVADESVNVIISNCVINLSPEKEQVFKEAFRVLKPGGRLAVSDIVATSPLSDEVRNNLSAISACVGGTESVSRLKELLEETGFADAKVEVVKGSESLVSKWFPGKGFEGSIASARLEAVRPQSATGIPKTGLDDSTEIKKKVYANFKSGLLCSEAISKTILETFVESANPQIVKTASAFGGGMGGSTEELCGALTGGVIALGALLGRETPGVDLRDCGALTNKFKERFRAQFGNLRCRDILDGFSEPEGYKECARLTAEASVILNDLIRDFERTRGVKLGEKKDLARERVELGRCPFSPKGCSCS